MMLDDKLVVEYEDRKIILTKNKGTKNATKISINEKVFNKITDFYMQEKYKEYVNNLECPLKLEDILKKAQENREPIYVK